MKIIISPAKKMNENTDLMPFTGLPVFLDETRRIMRWMQGLSFAEAKELWRCNEKLAELNFGRFSRMDLKGNLTPALLSYEGIQYQYMAPQVFTDSEWAYVQEHLRILSGFYGVLRPLDGVTPYRLEMQAKAQIGGRNNLYDFWGEKLYLEVMDEDRTVVNLASKEYSAGVEKYLQPQDTFLTCIFGEYRNGKVVQKGTEAKMARGEMVRFMAEQEITEPEHLRSFDRLGYEFREELSSEKAYVFVRGA